MKKIDLGRTVNTLANLGVLVGIVFLAHEIRQNTAQMRAEAAYSVTEAIREQHRVVFQDPEFAELVLRGEESFDDLSPTDKRRIFSWFYYQIDLAEYMLVLDEEDLSDIQFRYVDFMIELFRSRPGRREFIDSVIREDEYFNSQELHDRLTER